MDKILEQKIKDLSKEYGKSSTYRGSIVDDRMRELKERCYMDGAEALYEELKKRIGNWIDERCLPATMELGEGIVATMSLPESWFNKDDGKLPNMAIMMPGNPIPFSEAAERSARIFGPDGPCEYSGENKEVGYKSYVIPVGPTLGKEFPEKDLALMKDPLSGTGAIHDLETTGYTRNIQEPVIEIHESIKAPAPERSVAENPQSEKFPSASKRKTKEK